MGKKTMPLTAHFYFQTYPHIVDGALAKKFCHALPKDGHYLSAKRMR